MSQVAMAAGPQGLPEGGPGSGTCNIALHTSPPLDMIRVRHLVLAFPLMNVSINIVRHQKLLWVC
jgi:hypothetical protein